MAKKSGPKRGTRAPGFMRLTDQDKDLPLNEQIYRRIRTLIQSGALPDGSRVAPSRALAASLGVSRNSVTNALDRLIADGLLESRSTSGVYVSYSGQPTTGKMDKFENASENIPFTLGWATDIFSVEIWKRLQLRRWRNMPDSALSQGNRLGLPELRKTIASYVALKRGIECTAAQVIIAASIPSGVDLAVRALGLSRTSAWVEDPCGPPPLKALINCGVGTCPVPVDEHGIDVQAAIRAAPNASMALVSSVCQAPTGVTMSAERRTALLRWAQANAAWIFEDDFNWNGDGVTRAARPLAAVDPSRVIYLNSFNNILFPGLRIAYLVVPPNLLGRFEAIRGTEGEVNTPNQLVLTDFIESGYLDDHTRRLDAVNTERRAILDEYVRKILPEYLTPLNTAGGYYACAVRQSTESDLIKIAKAAGIVITGLSGYYMIAPKREEVLLGFSQYDEPAISAAASKLHLALAQNTQPRAPARISMRCL